MKENNVVFLAHRSKTTQTEVLEQLSCLNCRNKTWQALYEPAGNGFPRLRCAACGFDAGRFGWVQDDAP